MKTELSISEQNSKNASVAKMSPAEKAAKTPSSKAFAIAAYCYHECHAETETNSHTTKRNIKNCPATNCPLWPHRGWQKIG